jgi:protein-tyrosine-phosphatase
LFVLRTPAEVKWQRLSPTNMEMRSLSFLALAINQQKEGERHRHFIEQAKATLQMAQDADLIVTMGCNDQGIYLGPFSRTIDWKLDDPKRKTNEKVSKIRDDIELRV